MAKMIPPYIDDSSESYGERSVFDLLKEQTPASWTVLHSLNIPETSQSFGSEIDFLVMAPELGIFCLEVKGGNVSRKDGEWTITGSNGRSYKSTKGPFRQAENAMHALLEQIKKRMGSESRYTKLLISYGVIFTDIEFNIYDPEIDQWRIYDTRHKDTPVTEYIKRLSQKSAESYLKHQWFDRRDAFPKKGDIERLKDTFKGDFEKMKIIASKIKDIECIIRKYTIEQYGCLDGLEENPRCLFKGPAGTGKTMLALEAAKRSLSAGNSTLITCFNRLLAGWLDNQLVLQGFQTGIKAVAFLDYLEEIAKEKIPKDVNKDNDYYRKDLPFYALESLGDSNFAQFDKVIIDEGQDILSVEYIDVIDALLKGGTRQGKWDIFCDFERQNIFNEDTDHLEIIQYLKSRSCYVTYNLKTNCRNTREIAQEIFRVAGHASQDLLHDKVSGFPVKYDYYGQKDEAMKILLGELRTLRLNKVDARDVTILSPHILDKSSVRELEQKVELINLSNEFGRFFDRDTYTYSTIHKFKGMENSYIIMVDLDDFDEKKEHENYYKSLLYIGMSRAKAGLTMLVSEEAKPFLHLD